MKIFLLLFFVFFTAPIRAAELPDISNDDRIAREFLWQKLIQIQPPRRPKTGIALSGGGARGFAHIGVLEVLNDAGFPIDCMSGTSMGAVIGSLYCAGIPINSIRQIGAKPGFSKLSSSIFSPIHAWRLLVNDSLLSSEAMEQFLIKNIGELDFAGMNIPFACVAMDFKTGEKIIFREGPVSTAVRASMNIPGFFAPVEYRHRYLVDGGVIDFIPIDASRMLGAEWVLASITEGTFSNTSMDNVLLSLLQVIDIRGSILAKNSKKDADFVIAPEVGDIRMAELPKSSTAGKKGVTAAYSLLDKAKDSLILFSLPKLIDSLGAAAE